MRLIRVFALTLLALSAIVPAAKVSAQSLDTTSPTILAEEASGYSEAKWSFTASGWSTGYSYQAELWYHVVYYQSSADFINGVSYHDVIGSAWATGGPISLPDGGVPVTYYATGTPDTTVEWFHSIVQPNADASDSFARIYWFTIIRALDSNYHQVSWVQSDEEEDLYHAEKSVDLDNYPDWRWYVVSGR